MNHSDGYDRYWKIVEFVHVLFSISELAIRASSAPSIEGPPAPVNTQLRTIRWSNAPVRKRLAEFGPLPLATLPPTFPLAGPFVNRHESNVMSRAAVGAPEK
jgi:hypothetical protein